MATLPACECSEIIRPVRPTSRTLLVPLLFIVKLICVLEYLASRVELNILQVLMTLHDCIDVKLYRR